MSTRLLLNIALGIITTLLLTAVGIVVTSGDARNAENAQVDASLRLQKLVQDLNQEAADLSAADNMLSVKQARSNLGQTIVQIDRNLSALINGGEVEDPYGLVQTVGKAGHPGARAALAEASRLWLETGLPLADLAAGEFSIFSAAGQEAVETLADNSPAFADQMGIAATAFQVAAAGKAQRILTARIAVVGLGLLLGALGLARLRLPRANPPAEPAARKTFAGMAPASTIRNNDDGGEAPGQEAAPEAASAPIQSLDWTRHGHETYSSPVDFDSVNASVDQLSVDMNTIAGSTDKMRLAIDSVGHALQGMLFSLNEMAQDTAEGYKVVRGANNAASYTATTARELADSAQEMSRVVARVTQLALKTKQTAGQIEAEAACTGSTGEAFTSVVAAEVKGLSRQTSAATQEIENTVAAILSTARQYEEAIGQIIKNISAINKVSQNLGELMLHPPSAGVAGTPLPGAQTLPLDPAAAAVQQAAQAVATPAPAAPAPAPTPAPAPAPAAPAEAASPAPAQPASQAAPEPEPEAAPVMEEPEDSWGMDTSADQAADETAAAIEESAEPEPSGSSGNVFMLGGGPRKPRMKLQPPEPKPDAEQSDASEEQAEDSGSNIFMLNKPKKPAGEADPAAATPEQPEAQPEPAPAPQPEPEAAAETEAEEEDSGSNIFMLNKPKKPVGEAAPAAAAPAQEEAQPEPAPASQPEPEAAAETEAEEEDSGSNIFMLNKPKKPTGEAAPAAAAPAQEEAQPEPAPAPQPEPEAAAETEAEAEEEDSGSNIFMLNKPKKPAASAQPETAPPAEPEPAPEEATQEEEPVTVPPETDEPKNDGGSNANIFMLNKPKK